jgi:chitodextrinase
MPRSPRLSAGLSCCVLALTVVLGSAQAREGAAQERIEARASNKPLASLGAAAERAAARGVRPAGPREIPNFRREGRPAVADGGPAVPDAVLQQAPGAGATVLGAGFPGARNDDNARLLGYRVAPPDTDGEVGASHFVQMINSLTTIYDKSGNKIGDSFASNAIWDGIGGNCEAYNQGDPVVLYDEVADRWLASQFAFPDSLASFSQCVAISQTGDPTGAWNRYEFSFDGIGFNDYPKHGIVSDSITMIANLFRPRGPFNFSFAGTFLGVMDKASMYAGQPATMIGFNIGNGEFGFVAGDRDGAGNVPALFATAMSSASAFDIWRIDVDWATEDASASQIASIPITAYDGDLCSASREACIPQPNGGPSLEAISDRLMHRLQIRDFGAYRTMVTSHTVDVGGGRAGIRWYELRESNGSWSLYQEGTYGPADGQHRWMPSVAMNAAGDIGLGYLLGGSSTYVSTAVTGQSAANSGSGFFDSAEQICAAGTGVQQDTGRSGDYSATSVDPTDDSFWHTNEVFVSTGQFQWSTFVCNFTVGSGGPPPNNPPTASFTASCSDRTCIFTDTSTDGDGTVDAWSWDFGDGGTSTAQNPTHTYAADGTWTVTLTVTDDDGGVGIDTAIITVRYKVYLPLAFRASPQ